MIRFIVQLGVYWNFDHHFTTQLDSNLDAKVVNEIKTFRSTILGFE